MIDVDRKKGDAPDRVALVTGAGSGIGREVCLSFARAGVNTVVCDLDPGSAETTRDLILAEGGATVFVVADVSSESDVVCLVDKAVAAFGRLDYACNSAGIAGGRLTPTHEYAYDEWRRMIDVNLTGLWLCVKYQVAQMVKQGEGGAIVNISSVAGLHAIPGSTPYSASKHGVIGVTKGVALEYADQGIRVNAICPGYIQTPMVEDIVHKNREARTPNKLLDRIPVHRMGSPGEVADAVIWLCSDSAGFITGHALPVDGGITAQGFGPSFR